MSRILDVYLHEIFAGQLIQNDSGGLSFTYDANYVSENHAILSLSLPLRADIFEGDIVRAFFFGPLAR